jgi:L-lactate permease
MTPNDYLFPFIIMTLMICLLIIASVNIAFFKNKKKRGSLHISQGFALAFIIILMILLTIYFSNMYTEDGCKKICEPQLKALREQLQQQQQ